MITVEQILQKIKPTVMGWLSNSAVIVGGGLGVHNLASEYHEGVLADSQAPQFLLANGSRPLTGNLLVNDGAQVDGIDISAHAADPNAHHRAFVGLKDQYGTPILAGTDWFVGFGAGAGITATAITGSLQISLLTPGQLSAGSSNVSSGNHTHAVAASSAPGAASWLLKSDASGGLDLAGRFTVGGNTLTATPATARVGIGVSTPSATLDLFTSLGNERVLRVAASGPQTAAPVQITAANVSGAPVVGLVGPVSTGNADGWGIGLRGPADSQDRLLFYTDGKLSMGSGTAARDLYLSRHTASQGKVTSDGLSGAADWLVSGRIMAGQIAVPGATIEARSGSTAQLRLSYDDTNRADLQVGGGGNLTITPSGDLILDPAGNDVLPATSYDLNLGSLQKKFLTLHAAELWVETLVAQQTQATIGGRILVGPTTPLALDMGAADTQIATKYNNLSPGDICYLEAGGKVEFLSIASTFENYVRNASFEITSSGVPQYWTAANGATLLAQQPTSPPHGTTVVRLS